MKKRKPHSLSLGPEIIQLLLPHREPFLMVDRIEEYQPKPLPTLVATRCLSINEPIFRGHFPQVALYPGALVLEGMCQSAQLIDLLVTFLEIYEREGKTSEQLFDSLRNLELGYRFQPGYQHDAAQTFLQDAQRRGSLPLGVTAAVDVKFIKPVFAGQQLFYRVSLKRRLDDFYHHDAEAEVNGETVAKGTITSAAMWQPLPSPPHSTTA